MVLLQLIASSGWILRSFDIKAAFLQGKTQEGRIIGIEPVPELISAMGLKPNEICRLKKSAYGLIDAPFLWFQTLNEEPRVRLVEKIQQVYWFEVDLLKFEVY